MTERELLEKLANKWHLSVVERRALPGQMAKVSILLELIAAIASQTGWYPHDWRPEQDFSGCLLELLPNGHCLVHRKAEVSCMSYEMLGTADYNSIQAAAKEWLQQMYPIDIDGVRLDWNA